MAAGVRDEHVEPAETAGDFLEESVDLIRLGQVSRNGSNRSLGASLDLRAGALQDVGAPSADRHLATGFGQAERASKAQPLARCGHQCNLLAEVQIDAGRIRRRHHGGQLRRPSDDTRLAATGCGGLSTRVASFAIDGTRPQTVVVGISILFLSGAPSFRARLLITGSLIEHELIRASRRRYRPYRAWKGDRALACLEARLNG